MRTPVIIPAYNMANYIGVTLDGLNREVLEPIVVVNGSNDATADIARAKDAYVIERDEQGKLPAIQHALSYLDKRALDPVLYLDADSFAVRSTAWAETMKQVLDPEVPSVACGLVWEYDTTILNAVAGSINRTRLACQARRRNTSSLVGGNMITHFQSSDVLGAILELPHIWLGDDRLIGDTVTRMGGTCNQSLDPRTLVMTSGRYSPPLIRRVSERLYRTRDVKWTGRYDTRAAPTVEASYVDGKLVDARQTIKNKTTA